MNRAHLACERGGIAKKLAVAIAAVFVLFVAIGLLVPPPQETDQVFPVQPAVEKASGPSGENDHRAIAVVWEHWDRNNPFGISRADFRTKANPRGDGLFVYIPGTSFGLQGGGTVARTFIWLVLNGTAYPLNGASKDVTPALPWPRDVDPGTWKLTGLDPHSPKEAMAMVFGEGTQ